MIIRAAVIVAVALLVVKPEVEAQCPPIDEKLLGLQVGVYADDLPLAGQLANLSIMIHVQGRSGAFGSAQMQRFCIWPEEAARLARSLRTDKPWTLTREHWEPPWYGRQVAEHSTGLLTIRGAGTNGLRAGDDSLSNGGLSVQLTAAQRMGLADGIERWLRGKMTTCEPLLYLPQE